MIKLIVLAGLAASGTLVAADLPDVTATECAIVSAEVQRGDATLIDPDPAAVSLRVVVYCGHQVTNSTGTVRTERALKVIDVDVDQAAVLVAAADDLLDNGDVFLSDE